MNMRKNTLAFEVGPRATKTHVNSNRRQTVDLSKVTPGSSSFPRSSRVHGDSLKLSYTFGGKIQKYENEISENSRQVW